MPVLSIDYSQGNASALLINQDLTYKIARVPLMNHNIFFSHKPTPTEIFENLLKMLEGEFAISLNEQYEIYGSTYNHLRIQKSNVKFCDKDDAFKSLGPVEFLYFSHLHVGSNTGVFNIDVSYKELLKDLYFEEKETTIVNYFENLKLYPYLEPSSDRDFYEEESYLRFIAKNYCKIGSSSEPFLEQKSLVLSTTRSIDNEKALCRFMLLCVDSLCSEGYYTFKLDDRDFLGAVAALSLLSRPLYEKLELPEFALLGSVFNIYDDVSCIVLDTFGNKKEFQLGKDQIFTYPLSAVEKVKLTIKSKRYQVIEKEVMGGAFGIVIDTRRKGANHIGETLTLEQRKEIISQWEQALLHSLRGI